MEGLLVLLVTGLPNAQPTLKLMVINQPDSTLVGDQSSVPPKNELQPKWTRHKCLGDICYEYYDQPVTWTFAELFCTSTGGHLASIHGLSENGLVYDLCSQPCWLGFNDFANETDWQWTDGSHVDFVAWNIDKQSGMLEPNGRSHERTDAAYMYTTSNSWVSASKWDDDDVYHTRPFVCKRSATSFSLSAQLESTIERLLA